MDTGGGPLTIKRIVEDFTDYEYYVSGNNGVFMDHFQSVLPPSHILELRGPNLPLNLYLLVKFCRSRSIDILHIHGRGAASFARFVKIFLPKIKTVYTPNGFYPDSLRSPLRQIYILGERLLFALTDIIFFVSLSEQSTFSKNVGIKMPNKKFMYIQNYIDIHLPVNKRPLPYRHTLPYSPKFLFIGRLSRQKGVDILMESLKLIDQNFQATIIGYGEMEDYLKTEIEKNLKDKVIFIGKLNEAFRYMPNFDALLLPSRFEGLPFTVLEAMLYRLPLIVTPCNGTSDLVNDTNGYVAHSVDADAFAAAIRRFMNDFINKKNFIHELLDQNYDLVKREYSVEAVRQKINKLYQ
jgi:glycosyltransferase involved in cell wall biosynthesis